MLKQFYVKQFSLEEDFLGVAFSEFDPHRVT